MGDDRSTALGQTVGIAAAHTVTGNHARPCQYARQETDALTAHTGKINIQGFHGRPPLPVRSIAVTGQVFMHEQSPIHR